MWKRSAANSENTHYPKTSGPLLKIAGRSRGTPRICNALLEGSAILAQIKRKWKKSTSETSQFSLKGVKCRCPTELEKCDNKILTTIIDKFKGGPVVIFNFWQLLWSESAEKP